MIEKILGPTAQCIQSIIEADSLYKQRLIDFDMLQAKLQHSLQLEEIALAKEKERGRQQEMLLAHESYRHLLDTIQFLVRHQKPNDELAQRTLELCLFEIQKMSSQSVFCGENQLIEVVNC